MTEFPSNKPIDKTPLRPGMVLTIEPSASYGTDKILVHEENLVITDGKPDLLTRRAPRTDRTRAALLLWGGWLLVTGLVFSYMQGIIHPYYAIALAPPMR